MEESILISSTVLPLLSLSVRSLISFLVYHSHFCFSSMSVPWKCCEVLIPGVMFSIALTMNVKSTIPLDSWPWIWELNMQQILDTSVNICICNLISVNNQFHFVCVIISVVHIINIDRMCIKNVKFFNNSFQNFTFLCSVLSFTSALLSNSDSLFWCLPVSIRPC